MEQPSWRTGWSSMRYSMDRGLGRVLGSRVTLAGRVLGATLHLEEIVSERTPPSHKAWETIGEPRLIVIGPYRMGFDIDEQGPDSVLRIFIDYELATWRPAWLGRRLGDWYAKWCVERMAQDAAACFSRAIRPER